MSKKVLIISSSPRKGGNSDTLCNQFRKGQKKRVIWWTKSGSQSLPLTIALHAMPVKQRDIA